MIRECLQKLVVIVEAEQLKYLVDGGFLLNRCPTLLTSRCR